MKNTRTLMLFYEDLNGDNDDNYISKVDLVFKSSLTLRNKQPD